ncbi:hypothetical protein P9E76_15590 [Schinkia azotoformans]|nr:hypothetical protein [Schinkia azotoformans]MEC1638099.1 hypothetical protein [Schinkia azotoformans]MEC1946467.1 hypothetical protein [Schinkia azotoformans]
MEITRYDVLLMEQNHLYNEMAKCNDIEQGAKLMMRLDEIDDEIYEIKWS